MGQKVTDLEASMEEETELTTIVVDSGNLQTKHNTWTEEPKPLPKGDLLFDNGSEEKRKFDLFTAVEMDDRQKKPWIVSNRIPFERNRGFNKRELELEWSHVYACQERTQIEAER